MNDDEYTNRQGHLEDKEEEKLMNAVTDAELKLAYHPNLESLPDLPHVLEKIEFLYDLTPADRLKCVNTPPIYRPVTLC